MKAKHHAPEHHPLFTRKKAKTHARRIPRALKVVLWLLGAYALISAGILGLSVPSAKEVYALAIDGKSHFEAARAHIEKQEFDPALDELSQANEAFAHAEDKVSSLQLIRIIPYVGRQLNATTNLIKAVSRAGEALESMTGIARDIFEPFDEGQDLQFSNLTRAEKRKIFAQIEESGPQLETARATVAEAAAFVDKIPSTGLVSPLKNVVLPLKEQFPSLEESLTRGVEMAAFVPAIAGYPEQKTYLFLLQNNTEMRPTGGFIGTYGILKVADGEIVSFTTDNVYNLDSTVEDTLFIDPPWQLLRYNNVKQWFLRDANWSPDFPTSAKQAIWFYNREGGKESIDGVVAMTPTVIESLLVLVGPVTVDGITFTAENFTATLQYQVEQGFLRQGIPLEERKDIIGDLSDVLMERVLSLPRERWQALWSTLAIDFAEKHILLYDTDPETQEKVESQNWAGHIQSTHGDFLMVVDANLASLKSDPAVDRTIHYTVDTSQHPHTATVQITYTHTGTLSWKTTRYRTYVRVLTPRGSSLVSAEGAMVDCKLPDDGTVDIEDESGVTTFGTFVCTEVGETRSLTLSYTLPETLDLSDEYTLLVQKQPGTIAHTLIVDVRTKHDITWVEPFDKAVQNGDNEVSFTSPLRQDRRVLVRTK